MHGLCEKYSKSLTNYVGFKMNPNNKAHSLNVQVCTRMSVAVYER